MFEETPIPDLVLVRPRRFEDTRGYFCETWSRRAFEAAGLAFDWCQDNHSLSRPAGTLRGLHYQAPPAAQAKLVRCVAGRIWDVAVDLRPGRPSAGRWFGIELSAENGLQLLLPRGFLHGFLTLEANSELCYKVDNPYDAEADGAIAWNDPELAIDWPLAELGLEAPILSEKDAAAPPLAKRSDPFMENA